jgi:hypothetical protein
MQMAEAAVFRLDFRVADHTTEHPGTDVSRITLGMSVSTALIQVFHDDVEKSNTCSRWTGSDEGAFLPVAPEASNPWTVGFDADGIARTKYYSSSP